MTFLAGCRMLMIAEGVGVRAGYLRSMMGTVDWSQGPGYAAFMNKYHAQQTLLLLKQ